MDRCSSHARCSARTQILRVHVIQEAAWAQRASCGALALRRGDLGRPCQGNPGQGQPSFAIKPSRGRERSQESFWNTNRNPRSLVQSAKPGYKARSLVFRSRSPAISALRPPIWHRTCSWSHLGLKSPKINLSGILFKRFLGGSQDPIFRFEKAPPPPKPSAEATKPSAAATKPSADVVKPRTGFGVSRKGG